MLDKLTSSLDFQSKALVLRADRQRVIAGNIANADTPGYAARDFNFADALRDATAPKAASGSAIGAWDSENAYVTQTQPSLDGNSVDLDRERAAFADNAVRYEATLRFINAESKTMLSAIQGQ
jgi:flagellar basal-body rod protein FlgB